MDGYITVLRNGFSHTGLELKLPLLLSDLLKISTEHFGEKIQTFYKGDGCLLKSVELLRDGDILFAACYESFKGAEITKQNEFKDGRCKDASIQLHGWIKLNVGGRCFTTTRNTLTKYHGTMLERMFSNQEHWHSAIDSNGCYLIDRSPDFFEPILNYMRNGVLIINDGINPKGVLEEAKFFGIKPIIEELESSVVTEEKAQACVSRWEFMRLLMTTSSTDNLRCQGVNLSGADLSYLDLRSINFMYANLSGSNLRFASLGGCQLFLADLSGASLDDANLEGVQMKRANLEGASLKNCKFESQSNGRVIANLEGANLKGAVLEGSQMSQVNLRLAVLKEANMKSCVLRGAVLAGADLENCDLTGADLQDANLRGANVIGTIFLDIVAPLHMVHLM
ncbi:BTB/POZ domain-containing protein KCTD9 isoform X3 [Hydra vulgaris]|uniref:BTB/POZ domain-containing protein KCTD9 isoform X3 n=1 Tax=Hydra vulgaris TaxID=6087 RepID=A0ABM4BGI1_HYDVU